MYNRSRVGVPGVRSSFALERYIRPRYPRSAVETKDGFILKNPRLVQARMCSV